MLVLVGPTAVGKSDLAMAIAEKLQTGIISADSAQVYRYLDIGTAKPSKKDRQRVKHYLIDLVKPDQNYSVADYQKDADSKIKQLWSEGKLPFLVGGTGLYIRAVTERYAFGSKGPDNALRLFYEQIAKREGMQVLYERLSAIDPGAAKTIHCHDRKRIIRALEAYDQEGRPISTQVTDTASRENIYRPLIFGINMDRPTLYARIEKRVDKMIDMGFKEEVKHLYQCGYDETCPGMQILGYRQLLEQLKGNLDWLETVREIKKETRNLAKRQLTWFRREKMIEWFSINENGDLEKIIENICHKVKDLDL